MSGGTDRWRQKLGPAVVPDLLATTPDATPIEAPSHAEFTAMLDAMLDAMEQAAAIA